MSTSKISIQEIKGTLEMNGVSDISRHLFSVTEPVASDKNLDLKVWFQLYNYEDNGYFSINFLFLKNNAVNIIFSSTIRSAAVPYKRQMLPFVNYNLRRHSLSEGFNHPEDLVTQNDSLLKTVSWEEGLKLILPIVKDKLKNP